MRKGFTLLELIIVIIILGILATLGFAQYQRMAERARGAEARTILGLIRTQAAGYLMQYGSLTPGAPIPNFGNAEAGIGATRDLIPSPCTTTHYFSYGVTAVTATQLTATAIRCTAGGKVPDAAGALTLVLTANFGPGGADTWTGTGGY